MRATLFVLGLAALACGLSGCAGSSGSSGASVAPAAPAGSLSRPKAEFAEAAGAPPRTSATDSDGSFAASGTTAMESLAPEPRVESRPAEPRAEARSAESPATSLPMESRRAESERVARANRHIQSGTLTAGSFDDNERFEDFRQFVSLAMQRDPRETLPRVAVADRVLITVKNEQGEPIADARVSIRAADGRAQRSFGQDRDDRPLFDTLTGSDGRTMFLPSMVGAASVREFSVTVVPPGGGQPASHVFRSDQRPWQIKLEQTPARLPNRLDLALVVDTTGSMGDELEYLKVEIDSIAAEVHRMFPNVDQRYALVVYRDEGDQYVTRTFDFTGSLDDFRSTLSAQFAAGGGDYPEAMHAALEQAGRLNWRDRDHDTARVLFLVGDAPPHDALMRRTLDAVLALRNKNVRVFPVAASGADLKCEFVMRASAFLTLGQYLFLTDHSGVGNAHAEPHVPDYVVEHLSRLMLRMIVSELAGRRLAARDIVASGGPQSSPSRAGQAVAPLRRPTPSNTPAVASLASLCPPRWVILAIAIVCWFVIEARVERYRRARADSRVPERVEI